MITQEQLFDVFDHRNGQLYWKINSRCIKAGMRAGCLHQSGYRYVRLRKEIYAEHRLIFLMLHGYLPEEVDHINGCKSDNRPENLRAATTITNQQNVRKRRDNKSGAKGVSWCKTAGKFRVRIAIDGQLKSFGSYRDFEMAELVAIEVRNKYHKSYANHG